MKGCVVNKVAGLFLLAAAGVLAFFMGWATCFGLDLVERAPPAPGAWPMALVGGLAAVGLVSWGLALVLGSVRKQGSDPAGRSASSRQGGGLSEKTPGDNDRDKEGTDSHERA